MIGRSGMCRRIWWGEQRCVGWVCWLPTVVITASVAAILPVLVLGAFTYLVSFRSGQLFAPGDFTNEGTYLELHKMRFVAVASLAVATQAKDEHRMNVDNIRIDDVVRSVENAVSVVQEGAGSPLVPWVDDNPRNSAFERSASEAVGVRFVLSQTTSEALRIFLSPSMLLYLTWVVAKAHGRVTVFSMPYALAAVTLHYLSTLVA
jgi:hypothetical protein